MADVEPEEVRWLVHPYVPRRKLTLLDGDPGLGKTWLALGFAAAVSRGTPLANQEGPHGPGANALYLTAEDGLGDTLQPRLESLGADLSRIKVLDGIGGADGEGEVITLADLDVVEMALDEVRPALVVLDPIQAYLGAGVNMNRANETRPVLWAVARLAERYDCAVMAIRHLRKSAAERAVHRGLGSIDFSAAARSILLVAEDPQDPDRRIVAHLKSNLAASGESLAFKIVHGRFVWDGTSPLRGEELLAVEGRDYTQPPRESAADFLLEALRDGPVAVQELKEEAEAAGLRWRTVERAKADLKVEATRRGFGPGSAWYWVMPGPEDRQSQR
jgi:hypothetical protein